MQHLRDVCMTYAEHARFSLYLAYLFLRAGACAAIHALLPFVLSKSSSSYAKLIAEEIARAGCDDKED